MASIQLRSVGKVYPGSVKALDSVNLDVADGERIVVVGPSGSGKTTLIRLIAGLEEVTSGEIRIGDIDVTKLPPRDRDVAMVFQHPAVYPHLNVEQNLAFGPTTRKLSKADIAFRVEEAASLLGIQDLRKRKPETLSGGQLQRVAIGRAIARHPAVLLLDEPFSALDTPLRAAIRTELVELQTKLKLTMILVTHDQTDALAIGRRIAVVAGGTLRQYGTPAEIYERPVSRFVAEFFGYPPINVLPCRVELEDGKTRLQVADQSILMPGDRTVFLGAIEVGIRPERIIVVNPDQSGFVGVIRSLESMGYEQVALVETELGRVTIRLPIPSCNAVGDRVGLILGLEHVHIFA